MRIAENVRKIEGFPRQTKEKRVASSKIPKVLGNLARLTNFRGNVRKLLAGGENNANIVSFPSAVKVSPP